MKEINSMTELILKLAQWVSDRQQVMKKAEGEQFADQIPSAINDDNDAVINIIPKVFDLGNRTLKQFPLGGEL